MIDQETISFLQIISGIICASILGTLSFLIFNKNRDYFLNRLIALGSLSMAIGCFVSAFGKFKNSPFVVITNQIFWVATIICLLTFAIGGLYIWLGESSLNLLLILVYSLFLVIPVFVLFLIADSVIPIGLYGEYYLQGIAFIAVYGITASLIIISVILYLYLYIRERLKPLAFYLAGMVTALAALISASLSSILHDRVYDLIAFYVLVIAVILIYQGFRVKKSDSESNSK